MTKYRTSLFRVQCIGITDHYSRLVGSAALVKVVSLSPFSEGSQGTLGEPENVRMAKTVYKRENSYGDSTPLEYQQESWHVGSDD